MDFIFLIRAFNIIGNLDKKLKRSRHIFETLFKGTKARVLGIIENNVEKPHPVARKYFEKIKLKNNFNDL